MEHFVVVATYMNEMDAQVAQATLAAAGIESVLQIHDAGGMMPMLDQTAGVKVLVDEIVKDEAITLLTNPSIDMTE